LAADTPLLSQSAFSEDQLDMIERAAMVENLPPEEWMKKVLLGVASHVTADDDPELEPDDGDMPLEVAQKPQDERESDEGPAIAGGIDALILERLERLETTLAEVCVWAQTVLSEMYAHTGFATPDQERAARARAIEKFAKIKASVEAMMAGKGGSDADALRH